MVIGGILCRSAEAHEISAAVSKLVSGCRYQEAVQWKSLNDKKLALYKSVVDHFFDLNRGNAVDFSCIVFDKRKVDHKKHNENDPETGFFKFLYQHHLSHVRQYGCESRLRCFHGNMTTNYDMDELKRCLNGGSPRRGPKIYQPYVQVEFAKVKDTRCLQIADLLIGAVAYITNGKHLAAPFSAKTELAFYIQANSPVGSLAEPTTYPDRSFDIWHFRL